MEADPEQRAKRAGPVEISFEHLSSKFDKKRKRVFEAEDRVVLKKQKTQEAQSPGMNSLPLFAPLSLWPWSNSRSITSHFFFIMFFKLILLFFEFSTLAFDPFSTFLRLCPSSDHALLAKSPSNNNNNKYHKRMSTNDKAKINMLKVAPPFLSTLFLLLLRSSRHCQGAAETVISNDL